MLTVYSIQTCWFARRALSTLSVWILFEKIFEMFASLRKNTWIQERKTLRMVVVQSISRIYYIL